MWFRRDLRLADNAALERALTECDRVWACFCFDTEILDHLEDRADRRVEFIHQSIAEIADLLKRRGSGLIVLHGKAREQIPKLASLLKVSAVYANHDYEPARLKRDAAVAKAMRESCRELITCKDMVIFEKDEILNKRGEPFRVYTQYRNAWRKKLEESPCPPLESEKHLDRLAPPPAGVKSAPWKLSDLGFRETEPAVRGGAKQARKTFDSFLTRVKAYPAARDFPVIEGTSRLSVHLRFGTIGIREVLGDAMDEGSPGAQKWVDELIWREFNNTILHHFPHTQTKPFQEKFTNLKWRTDKAGFAAWCEGRTGYPIIDAAMRQLNTTGYMHNRLRMATASFLTKDLLIDWRLGERYFASKLLDYDMAQNLGGWQWSAGLGADAQPYFRIFNPVLQSQRFDEQGDFIRRFVPELKGYPAKHIHEPWAADAEVQKKAGCIIGKTYPAPIVDHAEARKRVLAMFKAAVVSTAKF
jgi:deoxyribodipyrimidine photo-lyase